MGGICSHKFGDCRLPGELRFGLCEQRFVVQNAHPRVFSPFQYRGKSRFFPPHPEPVNRPASPRERGTLRPPVHTRPAECAVVPGCGPGGRALPLWDAFPRVSRAIACDTELPPCAVPWRRPGLLVPVAGGPSAAASPAVAANTPHPSLRGGVPGCIAAGSPREN